MRPINRPAALLPAKAMQTYSIKSPTATHTRPATCEEVRCPQWLNGWTTTVPNGSPQQAMLEQVLHGRSPDALKRGGRRLADAPGQASGTFSVWFEAGTPCFKASTHRKSLERPEFYTVRGGDWRGSTGLIRRHNKPEHWVEDMQTTLDAVAKRAGHR